MLNDILFLIIGVAVYFILIYPISRKKILFEILIVKLFAVLIVLRYFSDKVAIKEVGKIAEGGLSNFTVYYWLGKPLNIMGLDYRYCFALISTYAVLLLSVYLMKMLREEFKIMLIVLNFYPDIIYFSGFTLRDVGIGVLSAGIIIELFFQRRMLIVGVLAFLLILLRPELFLWLMLCLWFYSFRYIRKAYRPFYFILGVVAFIASLRILIYTAILYIGWDPEVAKQPEELLRYFMDQRYERQFGDSDGSGGTSPVLSSNYYYDSSLITVILLQSLSLIYLSSEPANALIAIAAMTALPLLYYMKKLYKLCKTHKILRVYIPTLSTFLMYAPFLVNGGNAFRLRIVLIIVTITVYSYIRFGGLQNNSNKEQSQKLKHG